MLVSVRCFFRIAQDTIMMRKAAQNFDKITVKSSVWNTRCVDSTIPSNLWAQRPASAFLFFVMFPFLWHTFHFLHAVCRSLCVNISLATAYLHLVMFRHRPGTCAGLVWDWTEVWRVRFLVFFSFFYSEMFLFLFLIGANIGFSALLIPLICIGH